MAMMVQGKESPFDPRAFLATVGFGRTIAQYRKNQVIFSQGDAADAIFHTQRGKVKVTVVSRTGKEAVLAILGRNDFFGEGCLTGPVLAAGDNACSPVPPEFVVVAAQVGVIAPIAAISVDLFQRPPFVFPQPGFCRFISTTASISSLVGPLGPGR